MQLNGILPAIVTPLSVDGHFRADSFARLVDYFYKCGADGIYVCGQTGEGMMQSVAQRKVVAEEAVRNSPPGKQVIIHTGAHSTDDAVELTRHASKLGVAAVSSLPPAGSYSVHEVQEYYRRLASACDVPFLVYYFPDICPSIASADQIGELLTIPGVVGLKFTDFDLYKMMLLKQRGAVIYSGRDEVLAAGLLMGADGGIGSTYNVAPDLYASLFRLSKAGEWDKAVALQQRINEMIRTILRFPLVPAIKQILTWSGIDCGHAIAPRRPLTPEETRNLRQAMDGIGWAGAAIAA